MFDPYIYINYNWISKMNIIRQIRPKGAPIIIDAQTDDDGNILKETVRIFPILPTDPPLIGEGLPFKISDQYKPTE